MDGLAMHIRRRNSQQGNRRHDRPAFRVDPRISGPRIARAMTDIDSAGVSICAQVVTSLTACGSAGRRRATSSGRTSTALRSAIAWYLAEIEESSED